MGRKYIKILEDFIEEIRDPDVDLNLDQEIEKIKNEECPGE